MKALVRIGICLTAAPLLAGGAGSGYLDGWKRLVLADRKILVMHGEVTLSLDRSSYASDGTGGDSAAVPALILGTESRMSLFGITSVSTSTRSTLDAATGRSLAFLEIKKEESSKEYRFREDSYRKIRRRPPPGDPKVPVERWKVVQDVEIPYELPDGASLPAGVTVHDSYALLYLVGQADLSGTEPAEFVVISKGKLLRVRLRPGRARDNRRKVRDLATGRDRWLELRERELLLAPADPETPEAGFLSMRGEVEIWVDEETRALLEVSGKIPGVPGRTVLRLKAVDPKES